MMSERTNKTAARGREGEPETGVAKAPAKSSSSLSSSAKRCAPPRARAPPPR